jgi:hypothetical protein
LGRVSEEVFLGTSRAARKWVLAVVLVVAGVAAIEFLRTSSRRFVHEASGTVVAVDPAARTAKLEMIDPANGATRQFDGAIPETCKIRRRRCHVSSARSRRDSTWSARSARLGAIRAFADSAPPSLTGQCGGRWA